MTRTCTYHNLYFDSAVVRRAGPTWAPRPERGRWLAFAPEGTDSDALRPCLTLLRGYYHFTPEVVRTLPSVGGGAGSDRADRARRRLAKHDLQRRFGHQQLRPEQLRPAVVRATPLRPAPKPATTPAGGVQHVQHVRHLTFIDQKFHGCFGHRFLEENFAMYWALAEAQRTWRVDARNVTLFFDGHLMHRFSKQMWASVGKLDGVPRDSFRHIFPALARGEANHSLHREHPLMRAAPLTHFETVIVGGSGGRSPYNAKTFAYSIALHKKKGEASRAPSAREEMPYDNEYAVDEKAGAHSHYMSHLMRHFGFDGGRLGGRAASPPERPLAQRVVVVLNREAESNGRVLANAPALLDALVDAFGAARVHPRVESPATLDMPRMIALLRETRILISPHGSQNSNAGFMAPGAALLEVQAIGCQENLGYRSMSELWGLHYATVLTPSANKKCGFSAATFKADVASIVKVAARLDAKITAREQNMTDWVRKTMALPPRQAGDRWEPVTDCSPN